MSAQGAQTGAGVCGRASCVEARERGMAASGEMLYTLLRAAIRDGEPAAILIYRDWEQLDAREQGFFTGLVNSSNDAFFEAWAAD